MVSPTTSPLPPIPTGWQALHHVVLSDGTLAVAGADVDLASEWARILASDGPADPPGRIDELTRNGRAHLLTCGADGWLGGPVFPLETPHPMLDRFSDGRWLVVGSRTRGEPNARVLAPDGALLNRFRLGDGIEHIAIDGADRIWVGWFDEGVFGNTGWQVPGCEWPPSSNGIACFADDGRLIETPSMPEGVDHIADCYALAVVGTGAWICPYTDFALLRLMPGEPKRWWRDAPAGAKAIAVDGSHALLAGGYGKDADRLTLVALEGDGDGDNALLLATWRLPLRPAAPTGRDSAPVWKRADLLTGRGDTLHLVDANVWHQWRVADLVAALARR